MINAHENRHLRRKLSQKLHHISKSQVNFFSLKIPILILTMSGCYWSLSISYSGCLVHSTDLASKHCNTRERQYLILTCSGMYRFKRATISFAKKGIEYPKFLISGRSLVCQQEISLVLAKTAPIQYETIDG